MGSTEVHCDSPNNSNSVLEVVVLGGAGARWCVSDDVAGLRPLEERNRASSGCTGSTAMVVTCTAFV